MACLGGTWEDPRPWVRFKDGVPVTGDPITGRVCDKNVMPYERTRPRKCFGCPAYRGRNPDGTAAGITNPDGSLNSLRWPEYQRYVEAEEEGEPERFFDWLEKGGVRGWRAVDEGREKDNEYMRAYMVKWRRDHPGHDKRKRSRAVWMRSYRQRKKGIA